jgi:hypothetical protein
MRMQVAARQGIAPIDPRKPWSLNHLSYLSFRRFSSDLLDH